MPNDAEISRWEDEGGSPAPLNSPISLTFPLGNYGSITVQGVGPAIVNIPDPQSNQYDISSQKVR